MVLVTVMTHMLPSFPFFLVPLGNNVADSDGPFLSNLKVFLAPPFIGDERRFGHGFQSYNHEPSKRVAL